MYFAVGMVRYQICVHREVAKTVLILGLRLLVHPNQTWMFPLNDIAIKVLIPRHWAYRPIPILQLEKIFQYRSICNAEDPSQNDPDCSMEHKTQILTTAIILLSFTLTSDSMKNCTKSLTLDVFSLRFLPFLERMFFVCSSSSCEHVQIQTYFYSLQFVQFDLY